MEKLTLRQFLASALGTSPQATPTATTPREPAPARSANRPVASSVVNRGIAVQRRSERFPDVWVTNHRGERKRFRTDLVDGRKVILGFIYTRCEGICPLTTHNMRRVYKLLEDEFESGLQMISLSLDPARDTVRDLAQYAEEHRVNLPGWDFIVAGSEEETVALRKATGAYELDPALDRDLSQHSGLLTCGNDRTNRWMGLGAGSDPEIIAKSFIRATREGAIARLSRDSGPGISLAARRLSARMDAVHEDPVCGVLATEIRLSSTTQP
jgi:protein SCO1/2